MRKRVKEHDPDRSYPIPKSILKHPGVLEALDGPSEGFDYKWNIFERKDLNILSFLSYLLQ